MAFSRREFFGVTAGASLVGLVRTNGAGQPAPAARRVFVHGVASGDPLSDSAILWTRVTAPAGATPDVTWELASDAAFRQVVLRGTTMTAARRDFTVKIDATGLRAATTDPDLQEVHRQHPFIVVWDDHEIANNTWRDGGENHDPERGEGSFIWRRASATQAFFEWMPIREDRATRQPRIYRSCAFGGWPM
jgi:phosphodiesterase/alkaline phosphatase D-like protein